MNKLFKGAIASAAGVALLLGGAGTFAMWSADLPFGVDRTINAGHIEFLAGTMPNAKWQLNNEVIHPDDIDTLSIVPGDTLTMSWDDIGVDVQGRYLTAQFGVDLDEFEENLQPDELAFFRALDPTIEVKEIISGTGETGDPFVYGTPTTGEINLTEGEHHFGVAARVHFSRLAANELMDQAIPLDGLGLTVQQVPHIDHAPET